MKKYIHKTLLLYFVTTRQSVP